MNKNVFYQITMDKSLQQIYQMVQNISSQFCWFALKGRMWAHQSLALPEWEIIVLALKRLADFKTGMSRVLTHICKGNMEPNHQMCSLGKSRNCWQKFSHLYFEGTAVGTEHA